MNKTNENLRKAISVEAATCVRYIGFARKADEEGYPAAAKIPGRADPDMGKRRHGRGTFWRPVLVFGRASERRGKAVCALRGSFLQPSDASPGPGSCNADRRRGAA